MAKSAKKYPCKVDTCITQQGLMSFRVKLMRGGHLVDKSFDTLADARIFRDLTLANAALDTNEQATFVARANLNFAQIGRITQQAFDIIGVT